MTRTKQFAMTKVVSGAFLLCCFLSTLNAAEKMTVRVQGSNILPANGSVTGTWYYASPNGQTQILLLGHANAGFNAVPNYRLFANIAANEFVEIILPESLADATTVSCHVEQLDGLATVFWKGDKAESDLPVTTQKAASTISASMNHVEPVLGIQTGNETAKVELNAFVWEKDGVQTAANLDPVRRPRNNEPVLAFPDLAPFLSEVLIEWDWRMQDGIETPKCPVTFRDAITLRLPQVEALLLDLSENFPEQQEQWSGFFEQLKSFSVSLEKNREQTNDDPQWEILWRTLHKIRREILLANPLFNTGSLVFAKNVPSALSHQLEQEYAYLARPGGGIFVLDEPGRSMTTRRLDHDMPMGNYKHPSVTYDGKKIYFSFCEASLGPVQLYQPDCMTQRYHIWSMNIDGSDIRQLTNWDAEDYAPVPLPDGDIIFTSTKRGGFHRCGGGPCPVYTLAKMKGDGTDPHVISFHETQEWNPAVLNDGRIIYTRWDYVDRDASFYQNLWTTRQDGTDVRIFYGNNTFSPHGIWESCPVPGTNEVIAIAGPHHGMSAGSVILVDSVKGIDGPEPVTRLTPEVLFPESEIPLPKTPGLPVYIDFDQEYVSGWCGNVPFREANRVTDMPLEEQRWPLHCFKAPWALSEKYFIASYSFDKQVGEMGGNIANQFGLYFCDSFGTRELIYRDPNISSVWARSLAERSAPPAYVSTLPSGEDIPSTGHFYIQNVYESWPYKIPEKIKSLRVVQVLPKTTPNANQPKVGEAFASPGKQVLGTVPVEQDGSVYFEAPAKIPMLFQLLDENGRMVQGMRSLVYLQPGEVSSCTGCHENRMSTVPSVSTVAYKRAASKLEPGPDGSRPFSYPILVQPILDRLCISCHNDTRTDGNVNLTGTPDGTFSKSYNALVQLVPCSAWTNPNGNFEPYTKPDQFGARASLLTQLLDQGHYDCKLTEDDWNRLNTWMDTNALFYGTFQPDRQKFQLEGGRLDAPDLE